MKNSIKAALLGGLLLAAGFAVAGVTKATFSAVTFADGTVGTIYAGSKITTKATVTECDYADSHGQYLGQFISSAFASTDPDALESFCLAHFGDRQ
ncbi:MAG TPA: hypothetical protein VFJ62_13300 [Usitatibacter sp.]|nr:hypothetical protein [Usitatibacter sp.]